MAIQEVRVVSVVCKLENDESYPLPGVFEATNVDIEMENIMKHNPKFLSYVVVDEDAIGYKVVKTVLDVNSKEVLTSFPTIFSTEAQALAFDQAN